MPFADLYLSKRAYSEKLILHAPPDEDTRFIVVVPCYNEPFLFDTLDSLYKCYRPASGVEVVVVLNAPTSGNPAALAQNQKTSKAFCSWQEEKNGPGFRFFLLDAGLLPTKDAGVGLARKIGMDAAIRRFNMLGQEEGVLLSLDADSTVDENYFLEIGHFFQNHPKANGCTVYFEHPLQGKKCEPSAREAVSKYELHLRYFIQGIRFAGFPYAFHTVGSCFAVKALAYAKQGGMNKKQGGEDFYFLHKVFPLGNFHEVNSTRVIPSARPSDRVPFGTGPAIKQYIARGQNQFLSYHPTVFEDLKTFFSSSKDFFEHHENLLPIYENLPASIKVFIPYLDFQGKIHDISRHTASYQAFKKRFFQWFTAFRIVKYINMVSISMKPKMDIEKGAHTLGKMITGRECPTGLSELLWFYRELDKQGNYFVSMIT